MLNKPKLIVDFDSTICDTIKAYCTLYNIEFANYPNFKLADYNKVNRWDLKDECPLVPNPDDYFLKEELFDHLNPFPNAIETLYDLSKNYEIYICTIGGLQNLAHKTKWIEKYLPFIKNVILLSNNGNAINKSIVNMENAIFIDDHISNLESSNARVKICYGKEYVWNENWQGIRCRNWNEVYKILSDVNSKNNTEIIERDTIDLPQLRNFYRRLHEGVD